MKQLTKTGGVRKASRAGSRGRPEESRQAILKAATVEFATQGIAGARTDAIAEAAGVNKALLYYYFEDKEGLYRAVLEQVFGGLLERERPVLSAPGPALQKLVAYAATHFDYIAEHPPYSRLMQAEMMRAATGKSPHIQYLAEKYLRKLFETVVGVMQEGMRRGEIRQADPMQLMLSMGGMTVFYFISTPVVRAIGHIDPFSPEALQRRRATLVEHVTAILQPDGARIAQQEKTGAQAKTVQQGKTQ